jgi:hypothetical protein
LFSTQTVSEGASGSSMYFCSSRTAAFPISCRFTEMVVSDGSR